MPDILTQHGLLSLFLLSFCASTLLPLGSEWLLVALLLNGKDPLFVVAVASFGNSLGAITSYLIGISGSSWLPLVGDPLCLVAGMLRHGFGNFILLVGIGKTARYSLVAVLTLSGSALL